MTTNYSLMTKEEFLKLKHNETYIDDFLDMFEQVSHLHNDTECILAAVVESASVLKFASNELTSDREFMIAAINNNKYSFEFASDELKNDRELFKLVLSGDSEFSAAYLFSCASDELKNDKDIVRYAVFKNSDAIDYASDELKNDREFMRSFDDDQ